MPAVSDDTLALLTLHLVPGLGPRLTAALLYRFCSAAAVLQATPEELQEVPHIGPVLARQITQAVRGANVQAELDRMAQHETALLTLGSAAYPEPLTNIADPPPVLYLRGGLDVCDVGAVAVVGSRHCTSYGRRIAERIATGLAQKGITVVSGLARGIDGAAHRAALKAGGRTVAVLAGGLSRIYPPEHADLARDIQTAGALLSEATMAMQPLAELFPARNRIISGLSRGVVVVEAAERSGALITARLAAEQGRAVFAVPGPVDSVASGGTNQLLRQGATLVRGVDDILEDLDGIAAPASAVVKAEPPPGLDDTQRRVWDSLESQARHVDELAQQLAIPVPQLTSALFNLELKKAIRRLSGNRYERA